MSSLAQEIDEVLDCGEPLRRKLAEFLDQILFVEALDPWHA